MAMVVRNALMGAVAGLLVTAMPAYSQVTIDLRGLTLPDAIGRELGLYGIEIGSRDHNATLTFGERISRHASQRQSRPRKAQSTQPSAEAVHGGQPYDSERRRLAQDPERALLPSGDTQAVPAEPREARARQPLAGLALDPKGESRLGRPVPAEPVPSTERQEANPRVPELAQGARKEQPTAQLPVAGPTPPSDRREASAHPTHPERRAARVILPSPYLR